MAGGVGWLEPLKGEKQVTPPFFVIGWEVGGVGWLEPFSGENQHTPPFFIS